MIFNYKNYKKSIKKAFIITPLIALLLVGCSDDALDTVPETSISTETAQQADASTAGARQALSLAEAGTKAVQKTIHEIITISNAVKHIGHLLFFVKLAMLVRHYFIMRKFRHRLRRY